MDIPEDNMLTQPLLTEEGFINPACLNELAAAIKNIPPAYTRLKDDPEWSKKGYVFRKDIVGAFVKWSCRQSPTGVPLHLEQVAGYLNEALKTAIVWDEDQMAKLTLVEISAALYGILIGQGITYFNQWNEGKDFIDLEALLRNTCLDIRSEQRENARFDKDFDDRWNERFPPEYQI